MGFKSDSFDQRWVVVLAERWALQATSDQDTRTLEFQNKSLIRQTCHITLLLRLQAGRINLLTARRREQRVSLMVLSMVSCYMLCWMPYGVIALVSTFGTQGLVSPEVSVVPSILAKFSTVVNPVIYMFFNSQVRATELCNLIEGST